MKNFTKTSWPHRPWLPVLGHPRTKRFHCQSTLEDGDDPQIVAICKPETKLCKTKIPYKHEEYKICQKCLLVLLWHEVFFPGEQPVTPDYSGMVRKKEWVKRR